MKKKMIEIEEKKELNTTLENQKGQNEQNQSFITPNIEDSIPFGNKLESEITSDQESSMRAHLVPPVIVNMDEQYNKNGLYCSCPLNVGSLTKKEAEEIIKFLTDSLESSSTFYSSPTKKTSEKKNLVLSQNILLWLKERLMEKITPYDIPDAINDTIERYNGEKNTGKKEELINKIALWLTDERLRKLYADSDTPQKIKENINVFLKKKDTTLLQKIALWLTEEKEMNGEINKVTSDINECKKALNFKPHYYSSGLILFLTLKVLLNTDDVQQKRQRLETVHNDLARFFRERLRVCHKGFSVEILEMLRGTPHEIIIDLSAWILARGTEFFEEQLKQMSPLDRYNALIIWINVYHNTDYVPSLQESEILSGLFGENGLNKFKCYLLKKVSYLPCISELTKKIAQLYNIETCTLQPVPGNRINPQLGYAWLDNLYFVLFGPQSKFIVEDQQNSSLRTRLFEVLKKQLLKVFTPNIDAQYTDENVKEIIWDSIHNEFKKDENKSGKEKCDSIVMSKFITNFLRLEEMLALFINNIPTCVWGQPLNIQKQFNILYEQIINCCIKQQNISEEEFESGMEKLSKLFSEAKKALSLEITDFFCIFFSENNWSSSREQLLVNISEIVSKYSLTENTHLALVTKKIVASLNKPYKERGLTNITVYEVNLMFLYALYFHDYKKDWTPDFKNALEAVVYLVNDLDDTGGGKSIRILDKSRNLKQSSFQSQLRLTLLFLLWGYDNNILLEDDKKRLITMSCRVIIKLGKSSQLNHAESTAQKFYNYLIDKQLLADLPILLTCIYMQKTEKWSDFVAKYFKDAQLTLSWVTKNINALYLLCCGEPMMFGFSSIFFRIVSNKLESTLNEQLVDKLWECTAKSTDDMVVMLLLCANDKLSEYILKKDLKSLQIGAHLSDVGTLKNLWFMAAEKNFPGCIRYFILRWINTIYISVDTQDSAGNTALHYVVRHNNSLDILKLLSMKGADIALKNDDGNSPLHFAAMNDSLEIVKFLTGKGLAPDARNQCGHSPLHLAIIHNCFSIFKYLIETYPNLIGNQSRFNEQLYLAFKFRRSEIVKYFFEHYKPFVAKHKKDRDDNNLLHLVFINKVDGVDVCQCLIDKFPNVVKEKNVDGNTALHFAVKNGNKEIVKYLIEKGANPKEKNNDCQYPIDIAVEMLTQERLCNEKLLEDNTPPSQNNYEDKEGENNVNNDQKKENTSLTNPKNKYTDVIKELLVNLKDGSSDPFAYYAFALCCEVNALCGEDGKKAEEYKKKAFALCELSANAGNPSAQQRLAEYYLKGFGCKKNASLAKKFYTLSANENLQAKYLISTDPKEKYFAQAFRYKQLLANKGHQFAQYNLGHCYENGIGCKKSETSAFEYYKLAADQGYADAQYHLGRCYENGIGCKKGKKSAVKYYKLAADQGNISAQLALGWCYERGFGCDEDPGQMFKYYKLAADQGNKRALHLVGKCYEKGIGCEQNTQKSVEYFLQAEKVKDLPDGSGDTIQKEKKSGIVLKNIFNGQGTTNTNYWENVEYKSQNLI